MKALFFHFKLIFILLFFIVYIGLEINLNIVLVELYSKSLTDVFGIYQALAHDIELYGRVITGFGLALTLVTFIPKPWFEFQSSNTGEEYQLSATTVWFTRPLAMVLIWLLLIPTLRLSVDTLVHESSNQDKLSAIRAIVFKEALNRDMIEFEGSKTLSEIAQDEEQKRLLVALIPSLAYFSPTIKQFIEDQTEALVVNFMESEQEQAFINNARPQLTSLKTTYNQEWALYRKTQQQAQEAAGKTNTFASLKRETEKVQQDMANLVNGFWDDYQAANAEAETYIKPLHQHFYSDFKKTRKRYFRESCKSSCKRKIENEFHDKIVNTVFKESNKPVEIYYEKKANWFSVFDLDREIWFTLQLRKGRKNYLKRYYGLALDVDEDEEYDAFLTSKKMQYNVVKKLHDDNIKVPDNWEIKDAVSLKEALENKYANLAQIVWADYNKNSVFKLAEKDLNKIEFAKHNQVQNYIRQALGRFYYSGYKIHHSDQKVYDSWQQDLDNTSFIKMLTSTAAEAAFAPGGTFYKLGIEAVKFSVIPPVSIVLSFLAIVALIIKFIFYLRRADKPLYGNFIAVVAVIGIGGPVFMALIKPNSFTHTMLEFADNTEEIRQTEKLFTALFGAALDIESVIYYNRTQLAVFPSVDKMAKNLTRKNHADYVSVSYGSSLRIYDDWYNATFNFLPELLGVGQLEDPYDFNLTVFKRDQRVGLYAGIHEHQGKVTKVSVPNVFSNSDAGFLLEQKMFYQPDYKNLLLEYVHNVEDPEYWFNVASGDFGKRTLLNVIEAKTLELLTNNKFNYAKLIKQSLKGGHKNLLLIQQAQGSKYDCYQLPELDIENLVASFSGSQLPQTSKFECSGDII